MIKLDECLELRHKINDVNDDIVELRAAAYSPKNQIISDMPKGSSQGNAMDSYIDKLENLRHKKLYLELQLDTKWFEVTDILKESGVKINAIELLYLRFYLGFGWKKCAKILKEKYPAENWNDNKVFRVYRQAMSKLPKDNNENCAI